MRLPAAIAGLLLALAAGTSAAAEGLGSGHPAVSAAPAAALFRTACIAMAPDFAGTPAVLDAAGATPISPSDPGGRAPHIVFGALGTWLLGDPAAPAPGDLLVEAGTGMVAGTGAAAHGCLVAGRAAGSAAEAELGAVLTGATFLGEHDRGIFGVLRIWRAALPAAGERAAIVTVTSASPEGGSVISLEILPAGLLPGDSPGGTL